MKYNMCIKQVSNHQSKFVKRTGWEDPVCILEKEADCTGANIKLEVTKVLVCFSWQ